MSSINTGHKLRQGTVTMMFKLILVTALFALASAALPRRAPRLDGRIVGGEQVSIEDYPYQVSMQYYGSHMCGGSIIAPRYIVTAAHCTSGMSAGNLNIRAGTSTEASGGKSVQVAAIHQHPDYSSRTTDYDISILELAEDLEYGVGIQPIGLPAKDAEPQAGDQAVCSGWGALTEGGGSPSWLQAVMINIVSRDVCKEQYANYSITDRMICAGVNGGGKDACQGDSGGPLVANGVLAGVVSWGVGCARPNYAGVYSNVANLRDFITQNSGV